MTRVLPPRARPFLIAAAASALVLASAFVLGGKSAAAEQQTPVLLQAEQIDYDYVRAIVTARGNVEISDESRTLRADSVTYNQATGIIAADGHVSVIETGGIVAFADHVELTGDLRAGALQGFSALVGDNGRLAAASGTRTEGRYTEARNAIFTPCALCAETGNTTPVWQIKAARVIHDQVERELMFESARLEILGVPVLYLPYFTQADPTVQHKTGLLVPVIGSSTYLGTFVQAPYYFSLSPSHDLTIEPYLTTHAGDGLRTEYRQRWDRGGMWLQGSLGYEKKSSLAPGESGWMSHLFGSGRMPIDDIWRAGFDVQLTSNETYLRRYDISYLDRLTSDVFVDGVWGRSRASVNSYFFQSLRSGENAGDIPIVLPLAELTYIPEDQIYGGRLRVDTSALVLARREGTDMLRGSLSSDWTRQFIMRSGQIVAIDAFGRGDFYHVNRPDTPGGAAADSQSIGRAVGFGAAEWRWPFVRKAGFADATLVIEPIAQVVAATGGGNPAGIPNEDSTTFEFDETNLFIPNEFPGLDLWTGGSRSNAGVRGTAFFPNGASVEAILGQEFRTRRDPNFAPGSGVGDERSDIVGRLKLQVAPHIDLVHRFRIDPITSTLRRNEIYLTAKYARSTLDLSYLKLSPETTDPGLGPREQINVAANLAVETYWTVFADIRYDLRNDRTLEGGGGLRYEDECFMIQFGLLRRETIDRDLRPSTSVVLKIGLKTGLTGGGGL